MQFLDLTGVKRFKQYTDDTFITAEDVSEVSEVDTNSYTKQQIDDMFTSLLLALEEPMNGT